MIKFLLPLFICCSLHAQIVLSGATLRGATIGTTNAVSGGMTGFTVVQHNSGQANSSQSVVIDVTGSKLLIVNCSMDTGGTATPPSDGVNTYIALNAIGRPNGDTTNAMFYVVNPSGGSITISASYSFAVLNAATFTCGLTPFLDTQSSGTFVFSGTSIQPGSSSPASGSELFIAGLLNDAAASAATVDSSFTIIESLRQGVGGPWGQLAYKESATAENPTWTITGGNQTLSATMAVFGQH